MKKSIVVLLLVLAVSSAPVIAEGLGLELGVRARTTDLLNEDQDLGLLLKPFANYTVGDTGIVVGASWELPVSPETAKGVLEGFVEYDFAAVGLDFGVGADNFYDLEADTDALGGLVYGFASYGLPLGFSLSGEADFYYLPEFSIDLLATAAYKKAIGPVNVKLELRPVLAAVNDNPTLQLFVMLTGSYNL